MILYSWIQKSDCFLFVLFWYVSYCSFKNITCISEVGENWQFWEKTFGHSQAKHDCLTYVQSDNNQRCQITVTNEMDIVSSEI